MKRLSKKLSVLLVLAIMLTGVIGMPAATAAEELKALNGSDMLDSTALADTSISHLEKRPLLERPMDVFSKTNADEMIGSNPNPVRYNALGMSCAVFWDIDPNTGTYRDPDNGYTIVYFNPLAQGVISIPPYDCFVVEIRTAEAGSFNMRYGDWRDTYHGTVRLSSLGAGRTFYVSGVSYTEQIYWWGYPTFYDERPYFKAVSRPVGWSNPSSDGIMNWLQMYPF